MSVLPKQAASIAIAANGDLYVADPTRQQILQRTPSGIFSVVAGTGVAGLSGDGGQATRAELNDPGSLAVASDGTLFFVQQGTTKTTAGAFTGLTTSVIREIRPDGTIETIVGLHPNCDAASPSQAAMPAQSATFYGATLSIDPNGALDVATTVCPNVGDLGPFLQLNRSGELLKTPLDAIPAAAINCEAAAPGAGFTAFICASGGGHPKELLVVGDNRSVSGYPTVGSDDGAVVAANGEVVAAHSYSVVRVTSDGLQTLASERLLDGLASDGIAVAGINGIAVDRDGDVFLTTDIYRLRAGCEAMLVEIHANGRVQTLWSLTSRECY